MRIVICFFILIGWSACSKKTDPVLQEPLQLAKAYEKDPTPANADKFFTSALTLLEGNMIKPESKLELLFISQDISKKAKNHARMALFTSTLMKEAPQHSDFKLWCSDLVNALQALQNPEAAESLVLAYTSAFPEDPQISEFKKAGITPIDKNIDERIEKLGSAMFSDSTHQFDENVAALFIDACEALAMVHPQHPKTVDYLFKAATTARSIRSFPKALSIYDWIISSFSDKSHANQALFFKAFTIDNDLRDTEKAKSLYADFIKKYPQDEFADDAQFLMDNLGKSDEEILEQLKQNQNQ